MSFTILGNDVLTFSLTLNNIQTIVKISFSLFVLLQFRTNLNSYQVEGDILTGTCFVGLWDVWSMRWLVLTPLVIYISMGSIFLLLGNIISTPLCYHIITITHVFLGLFSLIKIRTVMKQDGGKTDKLEKLILRIGVFSVLYTVPACIIIGRFKMFQQLHYSILIAFLFIINFSLTSYNYILFSLFVLRAVLFLLVDVAVAGFYLQVIFRQ